MRSIGVALVASAAAVALTLPLGAATKGDLREVQEPEVVLEMPWGGGGASLGRKDGDEAASEGPMSFAVAHSGDIYVLDQVNQRVVQVRPGFGLVDELPLPGDTWQDLVLVDGGRVVVLDRLVRKSLLVLDADGTARSEQTVIGDGIVEGGGITAMFARSDGIWLEFGHTHVVRVLDSSLKPATREIVPGRLSRDGSRRLTGAVVRGGGAHVAVSETATGRRLGLLEVASTHDLVRLVEVDTDLDGNLLAVAHVADFDLATGQQLVHEEIVAISWDEDLQERGRFTSPLVITEHEQFREFALTDDGDVYQMAFDERGVRFVRWSWR